MPIDHPNDPEGSLVKLSYALVTPARNEEAYIEHTIKSVISQTALPTRWVIVSDGSTDRTDEIVKGYLPAHPWMELIRMPERKERHFAAKVQAFNAGYDTVKHISCDIIGNLDADLSFEPDYIEFLLDKFSSDPSLGVAGTPFIEDGSRPYDYRFTNIDHVSGACQLFRRECFDAIGGYKPIKAGGIDWVAVTTARMKGWRTRTFTEKTLFHHRTMGTGQGNILMARFRLGKEDYYEGSHPLWELFRCVYQMRHSPLILGGLFILLGYLVGVLQRMERPVSPELIAFHRKEQMQRLKAKVTGLFRGKQTEWTT
ncbi:MAG TPA: glycosyltransferase family 2 protein [Candidatus Hydrogenedentes bacterium]|nr:glycosyltransferase family 2 protein [Candidatus Hydrogenedentota bacterium]